MRPCTSVRVLPPAGAKTGHRSVTALHLLGHSALALAPAFARSALPRERVRSLTQTGQKPRQNPAAQQALT
jgi:hypothetical protein